MGSKSSPPAPDYVGAAQAQAAGSVDAVRAQAQANRVDQVTPYGNLTYTKAPQQWDPTGYQNAVAYWDAHPELHGPGKNGPTVEQFGYQPDKWQATVSLSPEQQKLLDQQNKTSLGLAGLQNQGLSYVQSTLDKPFDQSALPAQMVNAGQTGQDAIMARLQPQIDRERAALEQQMANQGITRGSEAWNNAQIDQNTRQNDLLTSAAIRGIDVGNQARQQAIQEQSFFRNEPINTLNAVRTGSQVQMPNFINVAQQSLAQSPDFMGAVNGQYNSALEASNASNATKAGQTQAGIGAAAMLAMYAI